ncbi:sporulation protein YqfC [Bacillus testis]|uniref:sporulation protein YqfC n=1 Tax=Bacillus testis TaxID=1622072 RepID=UPI00067F2FE6|nr:sporulation protein YqfC [Bacillus testis]
MAKKWKQKLKQLVTNTIDLPKDVMMDLPRITMVGQLHIYIENHRGLLAFSDEEIRLLLQQGQLSIKGNQFVIKAILPEEIMLEGIIHSVTYLS